mmetsp:Transcript_13648/g.43098  ORF Transcript_13648/g.43098 Transcript_13648/m.43098 type:complete len:336 (+) Transcript_13648:505-1512(+)
MDGRERFELRGRRRLTRHGMESAGAFLLVGEERGSLGSDDHGLIVGLWEGLVGREADVVGPEEDGEDGLDLGISELLAHALVHPGAEAEVGERDLLVLAARRGVAIWVEGSRIAEDRGKGSGDRGRDDGDVAPGEEVGPPLRGLDDDVLAALAHEHDEGRAEAKGLLDAVVQELHLAKVVVGRVAVVAVEDGGLLVQEASLDVGVRGDVEQGPGRRDGRRVLPGEEQRDEEARDLVVRRLGPVLVLHVDEDLENVGPALVGRGAALGDDLAEELDHLDARLVPLAVARHRRRRPEEGERRDALVEVVVERGDVLEQGLAHVVAVEAARARENGHL